MNNEPTLFDQPKENISFGNRIDHFYKMIKPTLTQREEEVYNAVKVIQPCTMHEVAEYMQRPLNTISGRFSSLVKKEFISIKEVKNHKSIYIINKKEK